jgi:hypothetical protein
MASKVTRTTLKDGYIARNSKTGRFVEICTSSGTHRATEKTVTTIKGASEKRRSALKRLADR